MIKFNYLNEVKKEMKRVLSFWCKLSCLVLIFLSIYFFLNDPWRAKYKQVQVLANNYNSIPNKVISDDNTIIFYGQLTAYTSTCKGCIGFTKSGYDVRDGNIHYYDAEYGKLRIVAADSMIPLGSIVKITAHQLYDYTFMAIVLDRGKAINGDLLDLLFENEEEINKTMGRLNNVRYEILRCGW